MFTSRDLLGELARYPNKADGLRSKAHQFMIPLSQMIYCSPKDSLYQCLLVMSELKVGRVPAGMGCCYERFVQSARWSAGGRGFRVGSGVSQTRREVGGGESPLRRRLRRAKPRVALRDRGTLDVAMEDESFGCWVAAPCVPVHAG